MSMVLRFVSRRRSIEPGALKKCTARGNLITLTKVRLDDSIFGCVIDSVLGESFGVVGPCSGQNRVIQWTSFERSESRYALSANPNSRRSKSIPVTGASPCA
jgi:hypothetical protein